MRIIAYAVISAIILRKTIDRQAHELVAVVVFCSNIAGCVVGDCLALVDEGVPDAWRFAVNVPRAFDLGKGMLSALLRSKGRDI